MPVIRLAPPGALAEVSAPVGAVALGADCWVDGMGIGGDAVDEGAADGGVGDGGLAVVVGSGAVVVGAGVWARAWPARIMEAAKAAAAV
jgi:hypothetical protein